MGRKIAYVFPGQGSQEVGMGYHLYKRFDKAREVFSEADRVLGFPLSRLCFEGPELELKKTLNAQPALVAVSLAYLFAIQELDSKETLPNPSFVAGHSLGEYTALVAAGVIDSAAAIYLARERGRLMHEAGLNSPGGMAAVIGLAESEVDLICRQTGVQIANFNCPGQLVISGEKGSLEKAISLAKERGARRVVPLEVSGAFHTPLMEPAAKGLAQVIDRIDFHDPKIPLIANTTARPLRTAEEIKEELLRQLTSGVQWQRSVEFMLSSGVDTFVEIGPGNVLSGLIRRINREVHVFSIGGKVEAIESLEELFQDK